jgi:hypothetical protein
VDGDRSMIPVTGLDLLERLHTLPGGPELLELTCLYISVTAVSERKSTSVKQTAGGEDKS